MFYLLDFLQTSTADELLVLEMKIIEVTDFISEIYTCKPCGKLDSLILKCKLVNLKIKDELTGTS